MRKLKLRFDSSRGHKTKNPNSLGFFRTCASRSTTARDGVAKKFSRILCVTTCNNPKLLGFFFTCARHSHIFSVEKMASQGREIFLLTRRKILLTTLCQSETCFVSKRNSRGGVEEIFKRRRENYP